MVRGRQLNLRAQRGIALLIFVIFLLMGALTYFLSNLSALEIKHQQTVSTSIALNNAKQALIAYAATYGDIDGDLDTFPDFPGEYGFLPCPDYNGGLAEGLEDNGNCGLRSVSKIGFFPWKTLDVAVLNDNSGTCLLYAVSGDYKNDESGPTPANKAFMLNQDSNGMFQTVDEVGTIIQGINPEDRVVAVVFAAGEPLPGQVRNPDITGTFCGEDYANYTAYLDIGGPADNSDVSAAADTVDQFIHAIAGSEDASPNPYNDRFVTITRDEIWAAIVSRTDMIQKMTDLTEALAMCMSNYAAANGLGRLPWPVQTTLANYRDTLNYDDNVDATPGYAGRLPLTVDNSNSDIGVAFGNELFTAAACNALLVTSGATVDLQTATAEYRRLWENWKDHFFYVVSQDYAPAITPAACGANCITVAGTQRAAMVVFAGPRQAGQIRNEPVAGDADTKFNVANYMENGNQAIFPDAAGNGAYSTAATNDIMFCLSATLPPVAVTC